MIYLLAIFSKVLLLTTDFGVFVKLDGTVNVSGLCHHSEISENDVENVKMLFGDGDRVKVKILKIDSEKKQLSLGMKASYFAEDGDNHGVDQEESDDDDDQEEEQDIEMEDAEDKEDSEDEEDDIMDVDQEESDNEEESDAEYDDEEESDNKSLSTGFINQWVLIGLHLF